jgi:hypothetical protein
LQAAPAPADATAIISGAALNRVLTAIAAADRGDKVNSAFLPPSLLQEVRFSGETGDALNLIRSAGHLPFPAVFNDGTLQAVKLRIEKDFAAAAAAATAVPALEGTLRQARAALTVDEPSFDFEQATAARRFLNQLDTAATVLKKKKNGGIVVPRWTTEGASVSELTRHMVKFKLQFGPAPKDGEEAYLALHRGLTEYLITLVEHSGQKR